jgi:hypothetical protein
LQRGGGIFFAQDERAFIFSVGYRFQRVGLESGHSHWVRFAKLVRRIAMLAYRARRILAKVTSHVELTGDRENARPSGRHELLKL